MTAVNVFIRPGVIHVVTDGLSIMPDGRTLTPKVFPIAHLSAVLACRGSYTSSALLASYVCQRAMSFEAAAAQLPDALQAVVDDLRVADHPAANTHHDCSLAGWAGDEPQCWYVQNHGEAPYVSRRCTGLISPNVPDEAIATITDPAFDPVGSGAWLIRLQESVTPGRVGGFAQLTSVYPDRIETKILERWSLDVAGA